MTTNQIAKLLKNERPEKALSKVLEQSEHVQDLVEECAGDMSSVNNGLKQELVEGNLVSSVENALGKTEAVELKIQGAANELSVVNSSLEHEVDERHILEAQLAESSKFGEEALHASLHDPLTGLPNRALFNDRLEHGLAQARRHGYSLAIMFVDLDDFKSINDSHGHEAGDHVLREIASRLKEHTRDDDTVCRHGGDEFVYVLMEIRSERDTNVIAQKIFEAVRQPIDISVASETFSFSIHPSIGISVFPKHGATGAELIDSADRAMYKAKRNKAGILFAETNGR